MAQSLEDAKPSVRFTVDIRGDQPVVVSFLKLVRDSERVRRPLHVVETLLGGDIAAVTAEARTLEEKQVVPADPLAPPPNRFVSVIEKIERLYAGHASDDDEEDCSRSRADVGPGFAGEADSSQYDTDDSFIDDEELDVYFAPQQAETKHKGFFVNRGTLETTNLPPKEVPRRKVKSHHEGNGVRKKGLDASLQSAPKRKRNVEKGTAVAKPGKRAKLLSSLPAPGAAPPGSGPLQEASGLLQPVVDMGRLPLGSIAGPSMLVEPGLGPGMPALPAPESSEDACTRPRVLALPAPERKNSSAAGAKAPRPAPPLKKRSVPLVLRRMEEGAAGLMEPSQGELRGQDAGAAVEAGAVEGRASEDAERPAAGLQETPGKGERRVGPPRGTMLERALQDLEASVAKLCPPPPPPEPSADGLPALPAAVTRKRLPPAVQDKLAKVARLEARKGGRISKELHKRLSGLLAHLMQPSTVKMKLRKMVEEGQQACRDRDGSRQECMAALRSAIAEAPEEPQDDGQGVAPPQGRALFPWSPAAEERLCALVAVALAGQDGSLGPALKVLYRDLQEVWPQGRGAVDSAEIKKAVQRTRKQLRRLHPKARRKEPQVSKGNVGGEVPGPATDVADVSGYETPTTKGVGGILKIMKPQSKSLSGSANVQHLSSSETDTDEDDDFVDPPESMRKAPSSAQDINMHM